MIDAKYDATRKVLIITADDEGREELAEASAQSYQQAESLIAEAFHEAYEFVDPSDIPGALTDAPILVDSDDVFRPDNGEVVMPINAKVFWFPNYAVTDPWEVLARTGTVEFAQAENDDPDAPLPPLVPDDLADFLPGGAKCGQLFYIGGEGVADRATLPAPLKTLYDEGFGERDLIDCGLYFVAPEEQPMRGSYMRGRLRGPYGQTWKGAIRAQEMGATVPELS